MSQHTLGWNLHHSYTDLPDFFYTIQKPTPVQDPHLILFNDTLASTLGLQAKNVTETSAAIFAGNKLPENSRPLAQAYAGHQFGQFTMLGDGRAVLLGEQVTPEGERVDIQLKGAGRTSYSRGGDGRATLGAMLREYIMSEAMHGLGIPTTRALALVTTGEPVIREANFLGAVLTRVASSHIRVGTFQYAAIYGEEDELRALADYTIERHYPDIMESENRYEKLLQKVIERQAALIAKWMHVGFIHGVMNTDNMSISGETIDYGPCAFMDHYDSDTVFSSIDHGGRYKYNHQPGIAQWNLTRFAETLLPLLHAEEEGAVEIAKEQLENFEKLFTLHWKSGMLAKLGLFKEETQDEALIGDLLQAMEKYEADFTNTFLALTYGIYDGAVLFHSAEFKNWKERWEKRREQQEESMEASQKLMRENNPALIPRNHRVEEALAAAVENNDYRPTQTLLQLIAHPYEHTEEQREYAKAPVPSGPYTTYCGT